MVTVKNIPGTSNDRYKNPPSGYKSWIEYWEKSANIIKATRCRCCGETPTERLHGGHVRKVDKGTSNHWYITPLCYDCNKPSNQEEFTVKKSDLIRVNP